MTPTPSGHAASSNLRAIIAMVVSQALFTVNDATMKLAAKALPGGEGGACSSQRPGLGGQPLEFVV